MYINKNVDEIVGKIKGVSNKVIYGALDTMENSARRNSKDVKKYGLELCDQYAATANSIAYLKEKFSTDEPSFERYLPNNDMPKTYLGLRNYRIALSIQYLASGRASILGKRLANTIILNSPLLKNEDDDLKYVEERFNAYMNMIESGNVIKDWRGRPETDIMGNKLMEWRELSALDREYVYKLFVDGEKDLSIDHPQYFQYESLYIKRIDTVFKMGMPGNYEKYTESNVLSGEYTTEIAKVEIAIWAELLGISVEA